MNPVRLVASVLLAALAAGCATLPPPQERVASTALVDTASTTLGRAAAQYVAPNPLQTGIYRFPDPHDAFAARVLLARAAEKSLDAQYFIWNGDQVGYLLFEALWQAAERGVRVRLLLDDSTTSGLDPTLSALDAHPNIELRLYNPFSFRGSRAIGYMTDFQRLNRRMHNKSFTADNQASIVGGRNIANEYFGAAAEIGFADIDVLAIGPAVREVSKEFDVYWNSASAYPATPFVGVAGPDAAAWLKDRFAATRADPVAVEYIDAVRKAPMVAELQRGKLTLEWATTRVIYDDPSKTLDSSVRTEALLFPELVKAIGQPARTFDIVSPYFVPGDGGTALLTDLAKKGIRVRVLTNSLAASDEKVVHAGYMTRREALLRGGVELWELKPGAVESSLKVRGRFGAGKVAGLHAKTYAVDSERIFVGSFNFDQRSAKLNTEMGILMTSPALASRLTDFFDQVVPEIAYQVRLAPDSGALVWIERTATGGQKTFDSDPETDALKRSQIQFLSIFPIEWLL